jgi:hypothetical protein
MEPIPVGTLVEYKGSWQQAYVVTGHQAPVADLFSPREQEIMQEEGLSLADAYPDGVAYEIWPEGMPRKFGNRMYMVSRVRRGSLTVKEEK